MTGRAGLVALNPQKMGVMHAHERPRTVTILPTATSPNSRFRRTRGLPGFRAEALHGAPGSLFWLRNV